MGEATDVYEEVKRAGLKPDIFTLNTMIRVFTAGAATDVVSIYPCCAVCVRVG